MEIITSAENALYKKCKKLKQKKYREESGLFLAEGHKFFDFSVVPEIVFIHEKSIDSIMKIIPTSIKNSGKIHVLSDKLFQGLSSQENSQGVILVYKIKTGNIESLNENIVILDRVSDPGNLGTIIRLCDAAGFKDLLLTQGSVDCYNEKVVRSSMGSIFNLNIIYLSEENLLNLIKKYGYTMIVTALKQDSIEYTKMSLSEKNAIVFGNEGNGASDNFLESADSTVIIPIYGTAESLNVATAAGIILYKAREILNY